MGKIKRTKRKEAKEDTQEDERERTKAVEGSCSEEEYTSKQMDEAVVRDGAPRPGPVPVPAFQKIPSSAIQERQEFRRLQLWP